MNTNDLTFVFVPGLLSDAIVFEAPIKTLGALGKCAVADLTSQKSITAMAEDTLRAFQGNIVVIGHSMGARVVFEMARLAAGRIFGIAVFDTGMHPYREGEEIRRQKLVDLAYDAGMTALAGQWLPKMVHPDRLDDTVFMKSLFDMVGRKSPEIHHNQIKALLCRPDASKTISAISCPTLVAVGRQDVWSPIGQHRQIHEMIKGSQLEIIENAGHFAPMEKGQEVAQVLFRWVNTLEL